MQPEQIIRTGIFFTDRNRKTRILKRISRFSSGGTDYNREKTKGFRAPIPRKADEF